MVPENVEEMTPPEVLDDQEIVQTQDEQEIDPAEIDPAELAQEAAMDSGYFDGQIPAEITAPAGLSPKRAELVRFIEWRRRTVAELEHLEEVHHRAIEALGGERIAKKKIDALIEADVSEVLKFALGGEVITATKLRAFERHQLEQKLKADKHAAQVAAATLGQIEHQIAAKTLGLRFLDNRFQRYVRSAVVEMARESDLGERYLQKIDELRAVLLELLGLDSIVGTHDGFGRPSYAELAIEFPHFGLPALTGKDLTISASEQDLEKPEREKPERDLPQKRSRVISARRNRAGFCG